MGKRKKKTQMINLRNMLVLCGLEMPAECKVAQEAEATEKNIKICGDGDMECGYRGGLIEVVEVQEIKYSEDLAKEKK